MTLNRLRWLAVAGGCLVWAAPAHGQNDWQSPDPYFGVFQHAAADTPQAERRYRAEIAPQRPHRLHAQRPLPADAPRRARHRGRTRRPVTNVTQPERPPDRP